MKNKKLAILLLSFFLVLATKPLMAKSLSVGWELWYPYQYHNAEQQLVGLDLEIFNAITKQANLNVEYTELPWKRHLQYMKSGKMDVAMGASKNNEREKYSYFTEPYRMETVKLFVLFGTSKQIPITSLKTLTNSDYMIGIESGYYYGKEFQSLIKDTEFQAHINDALDLEENIALLFKGHIDGFLADPVTVKAFADKYNLHNEFEQHPLDIYQTGIHIMLSKKATSIAMLKRFNDAIATLNQSGEINTILERWNKIQSTGNFHF
jgi:polar amino acid transport system substrate-binding protein